MKPPYGPQCRRAEPIGRGRRPNSATSSTTVLRSLLLAPVAFSSLRPARFFSLPLSVPSRSLHSSLGTSIYPSARRAALHFPCRRSFPSPRPSSRRIRLLPVLAPFSLPPSLSPTPLLRVQRECATQARARARSRGDTRTQLCSAPLRHAPLRFAPSRASRRRHRAMRSRTPWATLRRRESASVVLSVRPPSPEEDAAADHRLSRYALYGTLGRRRFAA